MIVSAAFLPEFATFTTLLREKNPPGPDDNFEFYGRTFTSSFFRTIIFKIAARETNKKSMMP